MSEERTFAQSDDGQGGMALERLRFALDVGRTGVWCWQEATRSFSGDRGLAVLWGLEIGASLDTSGFIASLHPDDRERAVGDLSQAARRDGSDSCKVEFRIRRRSDGAERWIVLEGRRYPDHADPMSNEVIGVARDITSRKQRDTHVHLLMREVTHRSKNLLAIIQAMARQTVKDSLTAAEFEQRFSARLRGLAASHDLLAARDWHGASVRDLVRWQIGPLLDQAHDRVAIDGPDLFLNPEAAQNIGLALNELSSNASRFGALSVPTGGVAVSWSLLPHEGGQRRFRMIWREMGGPVVTTPQRQGFGYKVVERVTARALDGEADLVFAQTGLTWTLEIPATFLVDAEGMPSVN